jgi:hypothetical protein
MRKLPAQAAGVKKSIAVKSAFITPTLHYTGAQLRSHFIRQQCGLTGDAIMAFIGRASVRKHLVDLEDREKRAYIYSPRMLHFMVEHFGMPLPEAVARQRLLIAIIRDCLPATLGTPLRAGDDIYINKRKLSVSIATLSPVSALIHTGINIHTKGAPVPAIGLAELKVNPKALAKQVLESYLNEDQSIHAAKVKVLPVG